MSSFHMMKCLLIKVTEGIPLDKRPSRNISRRSGSTAVGYNSSSVGESPLAESDGYNSGAIHSDEDLHNLETSSEGYTVTLLMCLPPEILRQRRLIRIHQAY